MAAGTGAGAGAGPGVGLGVGSGPGVGSDEMVVRERSAGILRDRLRRFLLIGPGRSSSLSVLYDDRRDILDVRLGLSLSLSLGELGWLSPMMNAACFAELPCEVTSNTVISKNLIQKNGGTCTCTYNTVITHTIF